MSPSAGSSVRPSRRRGFTLVELVIGLVVLSVLAALAVPTFDTLVDNSRDETAARTLDAVYKQATALAVLDGRTTYETGDLLAAIADLPGDQGTGLPGDTAAQAWTYDADDDGIAEAPYEIAISVSADGSTVGLSTISGAGNAAFMQGTIAGKTGWRVDLSADPSCVASAAETSRSTLTSGCPAGPVLVTVPGAPSISSLTPLDSSVTVCFGAPASDGGSAVTDYEYSTDDGLTWVSAATVSSPFTISGLSNSTLYQVSLRAVNSAGFPGDGSDRAPVVADEPAIFVPRCNCAHVGAGHHPARCDLVRFHLLERLRVQRRHLHLGHVECH